MGKIITFYTIEKNADGYTIWFNKKNQKDTSGGYGFLGVFNAPTKKECLEYCNKNNIKLEKR